MQKVNNTAFFFLYLHYIHTHLKFSIMNRKSTSVTFLIRMTITASFVIVPLFALFAQMKITGKLIDATTKETLPGVTISIKGKKASFVSGIDGSFSIKAADSDSIEFSAVGYLPKKVGVQTDLGSIELTSSETTLKEVVVTNNVAIARKTPVAVSTIKASQIAEFSANREFPELLENTPSVYVSKGSGGNGDSKINIRGFDQSNISVMVNGVPVNDMETSAVFWSNWSGLANINYYYKFSPKTELSAIFYGSIGRGGGTSYSYSGYINNTNSNSAL